MRRRLRLGRVLDCFSLSLQCAGTCACIRAPGDEDEEAVAVEREALVASDRRQQLQDQVLRLRDLVDGSRTLGFHLQPKVLTVELRVSMHCNGCARKVQKHISKMEARFLSPFEQKPDLSLQTIPHQA
uniref:HMA domain-containing protein n=1 Tax=Setaria viridis TaxID=4556 RepID=A0A4U6VCG2_SETVI|nr:hypothetical protein SEVIR_3G170600v2 [Setaria viridis]